MGSVFACTTNKSAGSRYTVASALRIGTLEDKEKAEAYWYRFKQSVTTDQKFGSEDDFKEFVENRIHELDSSEVYPNCHCRLSSTSKAVNELIRLNKTLDRIPATECQSGILVVGDNCSNEKLQYPTRKAFVRNGGSEETTAHRKERLRSFADAAKLEMTWNRWQATKKSYKDCTVLQMPEKDIDELVDHGILF
ncbi:uncharacterized protein I303_101555 [Kwoniella dejecticola CBS 10117]|uniref:Uncharacterized protein n=1 Tax=Kwoniella dejecticola CBS 10117 TaxID=1296121 RepID=A0A1A6ADH6_9TREE|nr:uncharacterized protein I303_02313 [Kwoniella dejecticola CBS 10117]OBR88094.1 hypothetical protein I303_02313 [Kwoniella dejecticola CBS 10117]